MEFRRLGSSGLKVSAIAFGNWLTHGDLVSGESATACVHAALDAGITTFDTADVYAMGEAERILGSALQGTNRESVEICTKVRMPTGPGSNERGLSRKHVIEACEGSLRRLGTDHVDLYQAHRFDQKVPLDETVAAFDHLVRQGKVFYVGVSEWTVAQMAEWIRISDETGAVRPISNQPQYSLLWRVPEKEVVPFSEANGLSQIVWSPLAQGVLTGKYPPGTKAPEGSRASFDRASDAVGRWMREEVLQAVLRLGGIASDAGLDLALMSLAWVLHRTNVAAAIIGASRPEQVTQNVKALGVSLDEDLLERIDSAVSDVVEDDPTLTG
jgi:aryl-alcohol dehydrogenase-like predicted oxidoreductase